MAQCKIISYPLLVTLLIFIIFLVFFEVSAIELNQKESEKYGIPDDLSSNQI